MRLGILGTGQLGRMLAHAAQGLGVEVAVFGPTPGPATAVTGDVTLAPWADTAALDAFRRRVDVVTYELEQLPDVVVEWLRAQSGVRPAVGALRAMQDWLHERELLASLGLPHARFVAVTGPGDAARVAVEVGFPCVVKVRRGGYDGKGQWRVDDAGALRDVLELLPEPAIAEAFVPWVREVSCLAARSADGAVRFYAPVENHHEGGILRWSISPAEGISPAVLRRLEEHMTRLMAATQYVGVMAVELFDAGGDWFVNELAPRVHNSGHLTLEGAQTSQFENHVRAVLDLPLGSTAPRGHAVMVNLIGEEPPVRDLLAVPGAHVHRYGKEPRPGRKLGHVTVVEAERGRAEAAKDALLAVVGG